MTNQYTSSLYLKLITTVTAILFAFFSFILVKVYDKITSIDDIKVDIREIKTTHLNLIDKNKEQDVRIDRGEAKLDGLQTQLLNHLLTTYESHDSYFRPAESNKKPK
jgi:hypothetical protein